MFSNTTSKSQSEDNQTINIFFRNNYLNRLVLNFTSMALPIFMTAMLSTITYPMAVKIARHKRLLKLRDFYAIHFTIAPFLGFVHLNFYAFVWTIVHVKNTERKFNELNPNLKKYNKHERNHFTPSLRKLQSRLETIQSKLEKT